MLLWHLHKFEIDPTARPEGQMGIDIQLELKSRRQTLDDFSERTLLPMARKLAEKLKDKKVRTSFILPLSKNYSCALENYSGCHIRGIMDEHYMKWREDGGVEEITVLRFDILWGK